MKRFVLAAIGMMALASSVFGQTVRERWVYPSGNFEFKGEKTWTEQSAPGAPPAFRFKETGRSDNYVELYDESRNLSVRLYPEYMYWRVEGGRWNQLHKGGWSTGMVDVAGRRQPAVQPQPPAVAAKVAGYLVVYSCRDGKALNNGLKTKLYGATRSATTRDDWLNKVDSYHAYQACVIELKTEADFDRAQKLLTEQAKAIPRPPANVDLTGTVWEDQRGERIRFSKDTFEIGEGLFNSDNRGTWSSAGNQVTLNGRQLSGTFTVRDNVIQAGLRTLRRIQ